MIAGISAFRGTVTPQIRVALWAFICMTPWLVAAYIPPLNADAAAILAFSQRMLAGEGLYRDLIDINPPMIFWLNQGPAALAALLGISVPIVLVLSIHCLIGMTLWLAFRILYRRLGGILSPAYLGLVLPTYLFLMLVYPSGHFAEREHILLALVLPYLAEAAARIAPSVAPGHIGTHRLGEADRLAAVRAGLLSFGVVGLAFVGIAQKPHFLALPLCVEGVVLWTVGWRRYLRHPQIYLFTALGILYILATALLYPDYFSQILPLAADHYGIADPALMAQLFLASQVPPLAIALVAVFTLGRLGQRTGKRTGAGTPAHPVAAIVSAAALGATLAGLTQLKDWDYHFLPARVLTLLAITVCLLELASASPDRNQPRPHASGHRSEVGYGPESGPHWRFSAVFLVLLASLSGVLQPPFRLLRDYATSDAARLEEIVRANARGEGVLWLTQYIDPTAPVLNYADARQAMPFMSLWLLPPLYAEQMPDPVTGRLRFHASDERPPAEQVLLDRVAQALADRKPRLIIAETEEGEAAFRGRGFDYLDYFSQDERFKAALQLYRPLAKIGTTRVLIRMP